MHYPSWMYYPTNTQAPAWVQAVVEAVAAQESTVSTASASTGLSSNDVLAILAPALRVFGFDIEEGRGRSGKILRPVLFGENGLPRVSYEVDGYHPELGIVLEVEAGRGARANAQYRDLLRSSLILDAQYLTLLLPLVYRFKSGSGQGSEPAYKNTVGLLDAVHASRRLVFPFEGLLLVGY